MNLEPFQSEDLLFIFQYHCVPRWRSARFLGSAGWQFVFLISCMLVLTVFIYTLDWWKRHNKQEPQERSLIWANGPLRGEMRFWRWGCCNHFFFFSVLSPSSVFPFAFFLMTFVYELATFPFRSHEYFTITEELWSWSEGSVYMNIAALRPSLLDFRSIVNLFLLMTVTGRKEETIQDAKVGLGIQLTRLQKGV